MSKRNQEVKDYFKDLGINQFIGLPFVVSTIIIFLALQQIDPNNFPYDNARYAYSAIFQGFAAILAIVLTAILITFQNIHTQNHNTEERIYKILGIFKGYYIPETIEKIEEDVMTNKLREKILSKNSENQQEKILDGSLKEIQRNFDFIETLRRRGWVLRWYSKISLGMIVIVLIYSLSALIIAVPHNIESNPIKENSIVNGTAISENVYTPFGINPITAIQILVIFVIMSLSFLTSLFLGIISFWKIKSPKKKFWSSEN